MRDFFWYALDRVPYQFWGGFTWLGDSGLLLPTSILILPWLLIARRTWPTALLWVATFGAGSALILASKLAFMGWCIGSARFNFTGFSGHTAIAASVWPVVLWLLTARGSHRVRTVAVLFGFFLATLIGVSRLAVFAHSASEVATGLVLGVVVSATFLNIARRWPRPNVWWPLIVLSFMTPLLLQTPGEPAPTQSLLEVIAVKLSGNERACTRDDLLGPG